MSEWGFRTSDGRGRARLVALAALAALSALALPATSGATLPPGGNGRIVYEVGGEIGMMTAAGAGQVNVTDTPSDFESMPVISPAGDAIVYWSSPTDDLFSLPLSGRPATNLTKTPGILEFASAFFPDGRRIAYSRYDGSDTDIWVMNADGSDQHQLTDTPEADFIGDVSPGGRRILFIRGAAGGMPRDVWVMNANGSGQVNLTNTPGVAVRESFASYSPDGRSIVYDIRDASDERDIWVMSSTGADQRPLLTRPDVSEGQPVFAPSGGRIAFERAFGGTSEIYAFALKPGAVATNLTQTSGDSEGQPDWESIQRCGGRPATIVGDNGPDKIRGTRRRDVIDANGGRDVIRGRGGGDLICGGKGPDKLLGGKGRDRLFGGKGRDGLRGGPGLDRLRGGPGLDLEVQ
jgi:hypothetical protein